MPSVQTNEDLINAYDNNSLIQTARILSTNDTAEQEYACQCVAIETLRTLLSTGITLQEWNDLDDTTWQTYQDDSWERAKLNVNAPVADMGSPHKAAACNMGGNYFERGYTVVMSGVQNSEKITFTRQGDGV